MHCVWLPQRPLQAGRRTGHQHFHLLRGHHQGSAHPLRFGGPGGRQLPGPQAARDAGPGTAVVGRWGVRE